jgi:hypothetical protein
MHSLSQLVYYTALPDPPVIVVTLLPDAFKNDPQGHGAVREPTQRTAMGGLARLVAHDGDARPQRGGGTPR